jgi:1-phosphatidylinositol-4-phosphate 5-kinase
MPSFVSEESSRIYANNADNADVLALDPSSSFGLLINEKGNVNSESIRSIQQSGPLPERFDESSTTSTHDSEISSATPMPPNGGSTHDMGTGAMSNGYSMSSANGSSIDKNTYEAVKNKPLPNGVSTTSLPDRTLPHRTSTSSNGVDHGLDSSRRGSHESQSYGAAPSSVSSGHQSPIDNYPRQSKRSIDAAHPPLPTIPSEEAEMESKQPHTPYLTPASPTPESAQHRSSPHRLSSPSFYQSGHSASNTSSSGHLQPSAAAPALKQRHTLEVPKLAPGRTSKDGMDTAQASGRFSPTVPHGMGQRRASLGLVRRTTRSMQSDYPRDEVVPDEDAIRWAEAYRQKRASKRRRKEEEDDDRVVVGTKVDESHANWVTAYNMLTGIRVSVSRTNAKLDRELTDADFQAKQKSTFDM